MVALHQRVIFCNDLLFNDVGGMLGGGGGVEGCGQRVTCMDMIENKLFSVIYTVISDLVCTLKLHVDLK